MLKRIFSYMKQYKKYACLALLCIAVEAVLELMVPMIMADLIDNGVALLGILKSGTCRIRSD